MRFVSGLFLWAALLAALTSPSAARAAEAPAVPPAGSFVVLDTLGSWRMCHVLKLPVVQDGSELQKVLPVGNESEGWRHVLSPDTAPLAANWQAAEFDDGAWARGPALRACRTPYLARLALRSRFTVTDPERISGARLVIGYYGGARVMLNGQEIARQHLPAGDLGEAVLAEAYPEESFVTEKGQLLAARGVIPEVARGDLTDESLRRIQQRERSLEVALPAKLLKRGLNVVAIEILRAPYHKTVSANLVPSGYKSSDKTHNLTWNTCEIRRVQLVAAKADGLVSGAVRPAGAQLWNSDPLDTDFDLDFGNPAEPLRSIRLVGARNGLFAGKVVVGSSEAIKGLTAAPCELKSAAGGTIPASAMTIRYAAPWGTLPVVDRGTFNSLPYPADPSPLLMILDQPLAEFPVRTKPAAPAKYGERELRSALQNGVLNVPARTVNQPAPVFGAVVPVWVSVKVPADAKAGLYTGTVAVSAAGKKLADVAVQLEVADWTMPAPQNYRTWCELIQSPETLALEYKAAPWSPEHLALIAKSFRLLNDIGSRVVYVPLVGHTNLGNEESMVRWIKKSDGGYDYDFSVMEKYLDTAAKFMGQPKIVVFYVWDLYLADDAATGGPRQGQAMERTLKAGVTLGGGPWVTVVDQAGGKATTVNLPSYSDPASKPLWQKLFAGLRAKLAARGLEKAMMLGMTTDAWPSQKQVQFMSEVTGGLPWVSASHSRFDNPKALYKIADFGYQAHAFGTSFGFESSLHGWDQATPKVNYERWPNIPNSSIGRWRNLTEYSIVGNMTGVGRLGADFWSVLKDKQGVRKGQVWERYPESHWRVLNIATSLLAPGPDGPVATTRYEALREGVQDCEARIIIEEALLKSDLKAKLGDDLAGRCTAAIEERHHALWRSQSHMQVGPGELALAGWRGWDDNLAGETWFISSGWQDRNAKLYALAGEVMKKLGK